MWDIHGGDGGADFAATTRIRSGWMKFPRSFSVSYNQSSAARDERSSVCQLRQKQNGLWK